MSRKRSPRWRCHECGAVGDDGRDGWTRHWIAHHQDPRF
jgi:hypothetical protein